MLQGGVGQSLKEELGDRYNQDTLKTCLKFSKIKIKIMKKCKKPVQSNCD